MVWSTYSKNSFTRANSVENILGCAKKEAWNTCMCCVLVLRGDLLHHNGWCLYYKSLSIHRWCKLFHNLLLFTNVHVRFCPLHLLIRLLFGWELLHWQLPVSHVASCVVEWPPETDNISLSYGHVQLPKTAALNVHTLLKFMHVNVSAANKSENVYSCWYLWHFFFKRNINSVNV